MPDLDTLDSCGSHIQSYGCVLGGERNAGDGSTERLYDQLSSERRYQELIDLGLMTTDYEPICEPSLISNGGVCNNPTPTSVFVVGAVLTGGLAAPIIIPAVSAIGSGVATLGSAIASGATAAGKAITGLVQQGVEHVATTHDAFDWIQLVANEGLAVYSTTTQKPIVYAGADGPQPIPTQVSGNLQAILKSPWVIIAAAIAFIGTLWIIWPRR